jgi:peptide/nickel transport system permease protein
LVKFILRRLWLMIPVLFGVILIVFCINQISGDPVAALLPADATQEQYEAKKAELGLDKPLPVQFFNYLKGLVTEFDLGISYQTKRPVKDEVMERYPVSVKLAVISIIISVVIGVPFGIISATKQYSVIDYIVTVIAMFFASMPPFWLGLMAIIIFSLNLGWFPASGLASWKHWILPSLTLGLSPVAVICRTTRSSMLDVIRQDYIRTARAKGLGEVTVIRKHALRNALIPVVTVVGLQMGFIVGGAMVVEAVFSIPGLGSLMMTAITQKNFPVVQGSVLILAITVCFLNLIVDILYAYIDPRIKAQYAGDRGKRKRKKEEARETVEAGVVK